MKRLSQLLSILAVLNIFAGHGLAATLLDDTWASGVRTNQNLPTSSAWFTSLTGGMTASNHFLNMTNTTSSVQWYTYYTPNGSPVQLNVGDTLTVSLTFTAIGVGAQNSSKNFRLGLYNSQGARATTDSSLPTSSYIGYALFSNFGLTWGASPDIRKRTVFSNNDPLNVSGDSTVIGTSNLVSGTTAFSNNVTYTITFSVARTDVSSNVVTATFSGGGLSNTVSGADTSGLYTNFDMIEIRPANALTTATNFQFTEFKVVGPAGVANAPAIITDTISETVETSEAANFNVAVSGAAPIFYQWYFNNVSTPVPSATNAYLLLTNVQPGQAGNYFVIATNSLNSATSSVATLTVTTPIFSSRGLVLDDTWADGSHENGPVSTNNSVWYASASGSFVASPGIVQGIPDPATSRLWVGYFTGDPTTPIDLAIGDALKVTLVFTPTNVAAQNTSSLRFGVFNYSNGGQRINADDGSSPESIGYGTNVRGYMITQNFGTTFGNSTPIQVLARTNIADEDLMGTSADYLGFSAGPAGESNAPAFVNGTQYTLQITAARTAAATMSITSKMTGGPLNISQTDTDTNYAYRRFDAFGIRPNRTTDSAGELDISEFRVEVIAAPVSVTRFPITSVNFAPPNSLILNFTSVTAQNYQVQSTPSLSPTAWITNATITATSTLTSYTNSPVAGNARFYRVVAVP